MGPGPGSRSGYSSLHQRTALDLERPLWGELPTLRFKIIRYPEQFPVSLPRGAAIPKRQSQRPNTRGALAPSAGPALLISATGSLAFPKWNQKSVITSRRSTSPCHGTRPSGPATFGNRERPRECSS